MLRLEAGETAEIKISKEDGVTSIEVTGAERPPPSSDVLELGTGETAEIEISNQGSVTSVDLTSDAAPPLPDEVIDVRDFGARDGQDSTDAWQRACDEAAGTDKTVVGHEGDTYILSRRGNVPMGVYRSNYCVGLKSKTKIDGRGCTFKLADNAAALCFANLDQSNTCRNLDIRNIRHDGNRGRQPDWSATAQEIGLIGLWNFEDVTLQGFDCWEVRAHAARILQGRRLRMVDCYCKGCSCDVWSIGLDRYPVHHAHLEKIGAEDVRHRAFRGRHEGNPYIGSIIGGTLLDIYGKDAGGGHKYQGVSRDLKVGHSKWLGGTHGTANCGSKFQGNQNSQTQANRVRSVEAEFVESEDCPAEGLRFSDCENVRVKHYIGRRNGGNGHPCVRFTFIVKGPRIDKLESYDAGANAIHAHGSSGGTPRTEVRGVKIGHAIVHGCEGDAVANHMAGCDMEFDRLECRNVAGRHANTSTGSIKIGVLKTDTEPRISGNVTVERRERF